jgi:hypothetical protein
VHAWRILQGGLSIQVPARLIDKFLDKAPGTAELWNIYGTWECLNITYGERAFLCQKHTVYL